MSEADAETRGTHRPMSPWRKAAIIGGAVLAFWLLQYAECSLLAAANMHREIRNWGDAPFDSATWKTPGYGHTAAVRGKMLKSLLHTHRLRGMARAQVLDLLGPPGATAGPASWKPLNLEASTFEYYLGLWPDFLLTFDEGYLRLVFDETGTVTRWKVWKNPEH